MNRTGRTVASIVAVLFLAWMVASVLNVDAQNMVAGDTTAAWNFFRVIF